MNIRYFDEIEQQKKDRHLVRQPKWAQRLFATIPLVHEVYGAQLRPYARKDVRILDAGCGKKGIMNKFVGQFGQAVGLDASFSAIKLNTSLDHYVFGSVDTLPFADETFDVVISQWVVEHLSDPAAAFREFYRVLKPGGGVILVTNSIYNPLMFFSANFPEKIRDKIKNRLLPPEIEEDTFPTYYRCNSLTKMEEVCTSIGFSKIYDTYVGDASFFIFSRLIFPLLLLYEKLTDIPVLRCFKMHVLGHYRKERQR